LGKKRFKFFLFLEKIHYDIDLVIGYFKSLEDAKLTRQLY